MFGIVDTLRFLKDAATSGPALAYYFGGINAATLQILGQSVDKLVEALPFIREAGLKGEYFTPLGSISYWEEIYSQMKLTNRELGLSGELGRNFEKITMGAYENIIRYGGEMSDLTDSYRNFIEGYGRNMMFSAEDLENIAKLRVAFGQGFEEIFVINQMIGRSIADTSELLEQVYEDSDAVGVNVKSTLENIRSNLSIIDRYSFLRGSKALNEMAINAERMRISIEKTVALADQLYDPENAIEIASQLQMLGGEFAKLGDPFELIFLARNEPEELQKRIAGVTAGVAALNKQTGEIDIDPLGFSQLREFASIANQDVQELAQAARQIAKEGYIRDLLNVEFKTRSNFDEILSKISSVAQYKDGEWQINLGQEMKTINELTVEDLDQLESISLGAEDSYKGLIESNRTLTESIRILTNSIMRNLVGDEVYQMADQDLKKAVQSIDETVLDSTGFKFMKSLLGEMQMQTYENVSEIIKGAIEGDAGRVFGQFKENIMHPFQQMSETLDAMNIETNELVKSLRETINPMSHFFEDGKNFFKKANDFFDKINNFFSLGGNMLKWSPFGGGLGMTGFNKLFNKDNSSLDIKNFKIEDYNGGFGDNRSRQDINFFQDSIRSSNTNLNLGINGNIKLDLEGESTNVEIFKSPQRAKELLGMLKPFLDEELSKQIETRIHLLGQDSKNSGNKTTEPNMYG